MFGYTVPSYGVMSASDLYAYRSCYCESCHQLRRWFGIVSTVAVNYDMTFNSIILNSVSPGGVKEQNRRKGRICILGRCVDDDILKKIAGYTVLLTKWELADDEHDSPELRSKVANIALGRAIRKAEHIYPEYDGHVRRGFRSLIRMEDEGCSDPVMLGETFARSLVPAMRDIAGDAWTDGMRRLFTSLGTMSYILDSVDDLDEDYMNSTFNPFLVGNEDFVNKRTFIQKNLYAVTDIINSVMAEIHTSYTEIRDSMRFHRGIADNVIFRGLPDSARRVIASDRSSKPGFRNTVSSRVLRRKDTQ